MKRTTARTFSSLWKANMIAFISSFAMVIELISAKWPISESLIHMDEHHQGHSAGIALGNFIGG
jgi:hypothetical protein